MYPSHQGNSREFGFEFDNPVRTVFQLFSSSNHYLRVMSIDYRCEDEKETFKLEQHLGIIAYLKTQDSKKAGH
jgi:hypothetical protein